MRYIPKEQVKHPKIDAKTPGFTTEALVKTVYKHFIKFISIKIRSIHPRGEGYERERKRSVSLAIKALAWEARSMRTRVCIYMHREAFLHSRSLYIVIAVCI